MSIMIGDRMSLLRKQKRLSQTELVKAADISKEALSKYERDEIIPSVQVAARPADILSVTVDYLIGSSNELAVDKETIKRIQAIEALDNGTKDTLFDIIDTFIRDPKARKAYA